MVARTGEQWRAGYRARTGHRLRALFPAGPRFPDRGDPSLDDFDADDYRRHSPRFQGDNFARNLALVGSGARPGGGQGVSAGQLALAWVLAQGEDLVPIPGTKRLRYLEENLDALDVVLTPDELAAIEAAFPLEAVAGDRYTAAGMAMVSR